MKHPVIIHEQSDGCIFKAPFNFRNFLADILTTEPYTLNVQCSKEMLDSEEFQVEIELEELGIIIVETLYGKDTKSFEWSVGEDYQTINNEATFWRWAAICGRKNLTTSNL